MADLTKSSVAVTQAIIDLLVLHSPDLGLLEVHYGDQQILSKYPCAVVETYPKSRDLATTRQLDVTIRTGITIYYGKLQSTEITKKDTEAIAELVEDLLHNDPQLGGLVVFGYVSRTEPGVSVRQGAMIRATRLVWEGRSREVF